MFTFQARGRAGPSRRPLLEATDAQYKPTHQVQAADCSPPSLRAAWILSRLSAAPLPASGRAAGAGEGVCGPPLFNVRQAAHARRCTEVQQQPPAPTRLAYAPVAPTGGGPPAREVIASRLPRAASRLCRLCRKSPAGLIGLAIEVICLQRGAAGGQHRVGRRARSSLRGVGHTWPVLGSVTACHGLPAGSAPPALLVPRFLEKELPGADFAFSAFLTATNFFARAASFSPTVCGCAAFFCAIVPFLAWIALLRALKLCKKDRSWSAQKYAPKSYNSICRGPTAFVPPPVRPMCANRGIVTPKMRCTVGCFMTAPCTCPQKLDTDRSAQTKGIPASASHCKHLGTL